MTVYVSIVDKLKAEIERASELRSALKMASARKVAEDAAKMNPPRNDGNRLTASERSRFERGAAEPEFGQPMGRSRGGRWDDAPIGRAQVAGDFAREQFGSGFSPGDLMGPVDAARTDIPSAVQRPLNRVYEEAARTALSGGPLGRLTGEVAEQIPGVRRIEQARAGVAGKIADTFTPREAWEVPLEAFPGTGKLGEIDELVAIVRKGGDDAIVALRRLSETPEGKRAIQALQSETGALKLPFGLGKATTAASDLPSGAAPPSPAQLAAPGDEILPTPAEDVLALTDTIRKSNRLRPGQERAFAAERKARAGRVASALETGQGDEAFNEAQRSLKGEFEGHGTFEPPQLDDITRQRMVDEIRTTDRIRAFEKLNAKSAFDKVMAGRLPEPKELEMLERVFGTQFSQAVLEKTPFSWSRLFVDVATLPKSALTTLDLSFPLRQGMVLAPSQPKAWLSSWRPMIKAFATEGNARVVDDAMRADPDFPRYLDSGGYHAPLQGGTAGEREESMVSRFVDIIPGVKNSSRAFLTFGNKLRFNAWKSLRAGFDESDETDAAFNQFVRHATGRGDVPFKAGEILPGLSAFFSLRNFVSRFQLIADPVTVKNAPMAVRAKIAGDISKFFASGITFLAMLKLAHDKGVPGFEGVGVTADPRSTDFGKIRIGDRRYEMWAGYQPIARYAAQIASGKRIAELPDGSTAKVPIDRKAYAQRFIEAKLDPTLSLAVSLWRGENFLGEPIGMDKKTLKRELWERGVPLFLQDLGESMKKYGPEGAAFAIPGALGAGVQDYESTEGAQQYAMKQVLPGRLEDAGLITTEEAFQSDYWKSRLPSQTVDPKAFESFTDYRLAYIEHWTQRRPEGMSEAEARDRADAKFESLAAVKEMRKRAQKAELEFWQDHPDLLQQAIDSNLEDTSKEKDKILEGATPR